MRAVSPGQSAKARREALLRPAERGQPKLRFAPRGLRYLERWSERFAGRFPSSEEIAEHPRYWNNKIPVESRLVEAPTTNLLLQRKCAQHLINACAHLIAAKPAELARVRVTCLIALPNMFSSEICLYLDENYYRGHTVPGPYDHGQLRSLQPRSLAREWNLTLPPGVGEWGVAAEYPAVEGYDEWYSDLWYFGEVGARP